MKATDFFGFLENSKFEMSIFSIEYNLIKTIRFLLRSIYSMLIEAESNESITSAFRLELLRLQSSLLPPSVELLKECDLSSFERNKARLGNDFANSCNLLDKTIRAFSDNESPFIKKLLEVVLLELQNNCSLAELKIWCHKREQQTYIDLFYSENIYLTDKNFISSLAEYRKSDLFKTLIRLGPLRTNGWSKTPSAIITAPRYKKLIRLLWSHSLDEEFFGVEPVIGSPNFMDRFKRSEHKSVESIQLDSINNFNSISYTVDDDDFKFLGDRPPARLQNNCTCILIEFPENIGVLLALGSNQLIFDDKRVFSYKNAKNIQSGDYLLFNDIKADFGSNNLTTKRYKLAALWKDILKEKYHQDSQRLINKLKISGINLHNLDNAIKRWMQIDNEVISAPKSKLHFELLLKEILIGSNIEIKWQQAWADIHGSRVNAILSGRIEHSIVNDQLLEELKKNKQSIFEKCIHGDFFREKLNQKSGLSGAISFFPVIDISTGFKAPQEKLENRRPISELELYRIDI